MTQLPGLLDFGLWLLLGVSSGVLLLAAIGLRSLERQIRAFDARLADLERFSRSVDPKQMERRGRDLAQLFKSLLAYAEPKGPTSGEGEEDSSDSAVTSSDRNGSGAEEGAV